MEGLINPKITTKNGTRNEFNPFAIEMLKKSMSKFLDFRFIIFFVKKSYLFFRNLKIIIFLKSFFDFIPINVIM